MKGRRNNALSCILQLPCTFRICYHQVIVHEDGFGCSGHRVVSLAVKGNRDDVEVLPGYGDLVRKGL